MQTLMGDARFCLIPRGRAAWSAPGMFTVPEGTKRATSLNARLLRTGPISRDIVNFPSELCRRRSAMFTEQVARLVPINSCGLRQGS